MLSLLSPEALALRIPLLLLYIRHPLPTVRHAVARALLIFVSLPSSDSAPAWLDLDFVSLIWEVIFLELRPAIRQTASEVWGATIELLSHASLPHSELQARVDVWISILTADRTVPLDPERFVSARRRTRRGGHDVDKPVLNCDLAIITPDDLIATRLAASDALAHLFAHSQPSDPLVSHTGDVLASLAAGEQQSLPVATRSLFGPLLVESWAVKTRRAGRSIDGHPFVHATAELYMDLLVSRPPPETYAEVAGLNLPAAIRNAAVEVETALVTAGRLSLGKVRKALAKEAKDPTLDSEDAKQWLSPTGIPTLLSSIANAKGLSEGEKERGRAKVEEARKRLADVVKRNEVEKAGYDVQRGAALASALVAIGRLPTKVSPVIKALTESLKVRSF